MTSLGTTANKRWEHFEHGADMGVRGMVYASKELVRAIYEQAVNGAMLPGIVVASHVMPPTGATVFPLAVWRPLTPRPVVPSRLAVSAVAGRSSSMARRWTPCSVVAQSGPCSAAHATGVCQGLTARTGQITCATAARAGLHW